MDRRGFFRTGAALGLAGVGGVTLPELGFARALATGTAADPIRLSSNENPLGVSPAARDAIVAAIQDANRYPGGVRRALQEKLSKGLGVTDDHIVLGAGSTEVLQMAVQAFATPRAKLVVAEPTFEDVPRYQQIAPYEMVAVPLTPDYAHDLTRMREEAEESGRPAVVYICNPNNPTGTLTSSADLDAWIEDAPDHVLFLVDEAYYEYTDDPAYWSTLKWVHDNPNVIVVRTFSKIYGMAGLRLGYGIAHPRTARRMQDFISSNNANNLAVAAGMASLGDEALIRKSREVNKKARTITEACLDELGLEYLPTHTNFVMHRIGGDLREYIDRMREHGFAVGRPFPPMLDYNRLSFSMPEHMERFSETLRTFRDKGWV